MSSVDFDLAICGAGPAGCALALLMAQVAPQPERIALIGNTPLAIDTQLPPHDPRALALNYGSAALLEQLRAWPQAQAALMDTVHVSQQGRLGRTLIQANELDVPYLGGVVRYDRLLKGLHEAIAQSGVQFLMDEVDHEHAATEGARIRTRQHGGLQAQLKVISDGHRPQAVQRSYNQAGILTLLRASHPKPGWAFERFTTTGPFALLPHPDGNDLYALVWCMSPSAAAQLAAAPEAEFAAAAQTTFGARMGQLRVAGERHVFPLNLYAGPSLVNPYTVAIGNAAQTLHPVAGQGLNLGLRDAAQLSHALRSWIAHPHTDPAPLLSRYAQQRRLDRWRTIGVTDFLPRFFATPYSIPQHLGGLGLLTMDVFAPARRPLITQLLQGVRR